MGTAIDMAFDGATLAACPLSALVLSFAFYGFCGWAWESTVCAMLNHGRFANSGFLLGPCCPIYGVGGIACWLLLRGIPDASSQFVAAALVCSVIEYSVGVLLEKTTGARFWDYSHLPFNLHGRICLYWACAFGLGALCICRLVEPALLGLLGHLPVLIVRLSAFIVAVAMMVDAVCSLASWRRLSDQLERVRADLADRINESLADASDSMLERIPDSTIDSVAQTHIRSRAVNAWLAELGDAVLIYTEKAKRENIHIIYQEPEMLPFVYGDKNRIRQVFINVIDNAIKYSAPGGRITVKLWAGEYKAFIELIDQGRGIPPEDLENVKTKFYKGSNSVRGSGIGLALVDSIMTALDGTMDIKSTLGRGTVVTLGLPLYHKV